MVKPLLTTSGPLDACCPCYENPWNCNDNSRLLIDFYLSALSAGKTWMVTRKLSGLSSNPDGLSLRGEPPLSLKGRIYIPAVRSNFSNSQFGGEPPPQASLRSWVKWLVAQHDRVSRIELPTQSTIVYGITDLSLNPANAAADRPNIPRTTRTAAPTE